MVLQKTKETAISQWVFYRAARIGPVETGTESIPDLKIAIALDQAGNIAKAIVTPFGTQSEEAEPDSPMPQD